MMRKILLRTWQNGWVSVGVTSPTADCGKTTACLNIAFSLAHQPDIRTVLADLDLRRPARPGLGLTQPQSMASVLQGTRRRWREFRAHGDNLAIGTNTTSVRASSGRSCSAPRPPQGWRASRPPSSPT